MAAMAGTVPGKRARGSGLGFWLLPGLHLVFVEVEEDVLGVQFGQQRAR